MLPDFPDHGPQMARVAAAQQLLFPTHPRAVCDSLGLNWWAALKLHEEGWLSFNPAETERLDEAQEAELRFVGSLVLAGCDGGMLRILLGGLSKPYAYRSNRLYYDWAARSWRLFPDPREDQEASNSPTTPCRASAPNPRSRNSIGTHNPPRGRAGNALRAAYSQGNSENAASAS